MHSQVEQLLNLPLIQYIFVLNEPLLKICCPVCSQVDAVDPSAALMWIFGTILTVSAAYYVWTGQMLLLPSACDKLHDACTRQGASRR